MVSEKTKKFIELLNRVDKDELVEIDQDLSEAVEETDDEELVNTYQVMRRIIKRINSGKHFQNVIRDGVHDVVQQSYKNQEVFGKKSVTHFLSNQDDTRIQEKRKQIYEILNNLDERVSGENMEEATAVFTTIMDILSQICTQRTDGVISIRIRLDEFFSLYEGDGKLKPEYKREVNLMFSPEEITAMQIQLPSLKKDDPMANFFTAVLDQAYDVVKFNEMTGNLLLVMSKYFIENSKGETEREKELIAEFKERLERLEVAMMKAIEDLCEAEKKVNRHLDERQILSQLPRLLRALINIRLGFPGGESAVAIVKKIAGAKEEYSRARSAVAFDFDLLPSLQHNVHLRQSTVLNLQKDVICYMQDKQEQEMQTIEKELNQIVKDIETNSQQLKPGTPEYKDMMHKKELLQKRIEQARRKRDVLRCQNHLVDVHKTMIADAIQRYQVNQKEVSDKIIAHRKRAVTKKTAPKEKKKSQGMVNPKRLTR